MSFALWAYLAINAVYVLFLLGSGYAFGSKLIPMMAITFVVTFVVVYLPLKILGAFIRGRRN